MATTFQKTSVFLSTSGKSTMMSKYSQNLKTPDTFQLS